MNKYLLPIFLCLAAAGVLVGCPGGGNATTYTVHGTVSLYLVGATGNAIVTVTQASNSYTASVAVPQNLDQQILTYSISGVPSGTYSISIELTASAPASHFYVLNNSGSQIEAPVAASGPTCTMTASGIAVGADLQFDATMGNPGGASAVAGSAFTVAREVLDA